MQKVATKITKDGDKVHLYRVHPIRRHFAIGKKGDKLGTIYNTYKDAFDEWDKVFDYRKTK